MAVPTKMVIQPSYSQKLQMGKWIAPGLIGIYVLLYLGQTLVKFNSPLVSEIISSSSDFIMATLVVGLIVKIISAIFNFGEDKLVTGISEPVSLLDNVKLRIGEPLSVSHAKGSFKRSYKQ